MKTKRQLFLALSLLPSLLYAQNETRRWAIEGNIGPTFIKNKTQLKDEFNVDNGFKSYLGVEYYIPESHFSARLGYQSETLNLATQSVQADQQTINISGRWYPAPEKWIIQPYLGLGANILIGNNNTNEAIENSQNDVKTFKANINSPFIAFTPSAGFDIYILSSVALYANYSYNLGINGKYDLDYSATNNMAMEHVSGSLNHHNLSFGLKITFPFHLTTEDGETIFTSIFGSLWESNNSKRNSKANRYNSLNQY